jgi:heme-degrading monooxygenase HmoA
VEHHLAEYNIARLRVPLEAAENAEFVSVLEAVNAIAEVSPGFVWRLTDEGERSASYVQVYDDPLLIVNFSVWTDLESLRHFTYRSGHAAYFRRRKEWFEDAGSRLVCWWIPAGTTPTVDEARRRLDHLAEHGPTPEAFTFAMSFTPDGSPS